MVETHFFSFHHAHISNILELLMASIGEVTTEMVVAMAPQCLPSQILPKSRNFLHQTSRNTHLPSFLCLPDLYLLPLLPQVIATILTPSPWLLVAPPCSLAPLTPHLLLLPSTYSRPWTLCCNGSTINLHPLLLPLLFCHLLSKVPIISHSGKNSHLA